MVGRLVLGRVLGGVQREGEGERREEGRKRKDRSVGLTCYMSVIYMSVI